MEHARRKNAIVIAPDYPLGPEANYKDIVDSIREFLQWYGADGCFEPGFKSWREWLITTAKLGHVELLFDRVLMEGESAGGHAAVTALFRNAAKKNTRKLNIDAVLLRYPMLKHYTRKFPDEGSVTYMNKKFSKEQVDAQVNKINAAVDELERVDLVPTRAGDHPPHGMAFAFLLSMSGKWEESFTRRHHRDHDAEMPGDPDYMDCLERAHYYAPNVENARLPPIMMYHGHDDPNCPFSDTQQFLDFLTQKYDGRYTKGETVVLEKVYELNAKPQFDAKKGMLVQGPTTAVGHGFDYSLEEEKEPFLKRTHEGIDGFWGKM
jgi:acetyl esterase/lipase